MPSSIEPFCGALITFMSYRGKTKRIIPAGNLFDKVARHFVIPAPNHYFYDCIGVIICKQFALIRLGIFNLTIMHKRDMMPNFVRQGITDAYRNYWAPP